jgi:hypothetical protein
MTDDIYDQLILQKEGGRLKAPKSSKQGSLLNAFMPKA